MNPYSQSSLDQTFGNGMMRQAASRKTSANGPFPEQFNSFPDWMNPQAGMQPLKNFKQSIPSYFNPRAMMQQSKSVGSGMVDQGRASTNAAAQGMIARQLQAGGTASGAGFAQAQGMLPYYQQQREGLLDAQKLKMGMRGQQAGMMGQVAGQMSQLAARNQADRTGYAVEQQRLAQRDSEFEMGMGGGSTSGGGRGGAGAWSDRSVGMGTPNLGPMYLSQQLSNRGMGSPQAVGHAQDSLAAMKRAGYAW